MSIDNAAQEILDFWFRQSVDGKAPAPQLSLWWGKDVAVDEQIIQSFKKHYLKAISGEYDHWQESPRALLAFIILLDQFSRHMFRDDSRAFDADPLAVSWVNEGIKRGYDKTYTFSERTFFYLPFEHAEDLAYQEKSVALFLAMYEDCDEKDKEAGKGAYDYALGHHKIIERFGRFPHRNNALKRETTDEEVQFLTEPNSSY